MKVFVLLLRALGVLLAILAGVIISSALYEASLKGGLQSVVEMIIELNIVNWISAILLCIPALGAFSMASYLEGKYCFEHLTDNC